MRKLIIIIISFFTLLGFSQNSNKEEILFQEKKVHLKNQDDLEEYLYLFFDTYIKTKQVDILKKGIKSTWRKPTTNDEKIALLHLNINIAYFYMKAGEFSNSIAFYEKALLFFQTNNIKNYNIVKNCLKPLANNYTRLGDYQRAEELYKYTIDTALKNNNNQQLIGTYLNLAILLQSTNQNNEAIALLKNTLVLKNISKKQRQQIKSTIAKNYFLLNEYEKALLYLESLETNYQNTITKASCYHKLNKLKKAEKLFLKALKISKSNNYSARVIAKNHNQLAKVYLSENQLLKSLKSYQNSLQELLPGFHPSNPNKNPLLKNVYAENTILDALDGKAKVFMLQNNYQKSIDTYQLAFEVERLLHQTNSSQKAEIIHQQENRKRSEKIVDLYHYLYLISPKESYIKNAFQITERSKSIILLEKLNYYSNKQSVKKDTLLIKEQSLVKHKAVLSRKIKLEQLKKSDANINLIKNLIREKAKTTTSLEVLKQKIHQKYPFINKDMNPISIQKIQQELLVDNQLLIEFFDAKKHVYIFYLTKNKPIQWRKISKDKKYETALKQYLNLFISDGGKKIKNNVTAYQKSAYYLYKTLLKPILTDNTNFISIIPDGKLNFLAFDALLTKNTNYQSFEKLPYLIYKQQINYGFSTYILWSQKKQSKNKNQTKSVLGFFPFFENNYRNLQELTYTLEEKNTLTTIKQNLLLEKEEATKEQFLKNANNYSILHLSTHASAGDFEIPAHIEFRNETLYLPEIYGLNLPSNLLVLSACETGIGKLHKGEGSMSLARGFLYAGIKNLVVSQWKVNDKSTSILIQDFYKNYKKTTAISSSLHKAKLNYLQDKDISNLNKTPYYWAGFQFIGNHQNVQQNLYSPYLYPTLLLLLLIMVFYFYEKHRNK